MIRKLAFIFLFIVLGTIGLLGYSIFTELKEKQAVSERIAMLPAFSAINFEDETVQSESIASARPVILTYFNTGCDFCQAEISSIRKHKKLHQKADIYLISDESKAGLKQFAKDFKLDSLQAIQVLHDSNKQVKELFGITGVPTSFVYNNENKLVKSFKGETKAEVLYELVKE